MARLNETIELSDPENPQFGTKVWHLSPIQAKLEPILCPNSQIFVIRATVVGHGPIFLNDTIKLADLENQQFSQQSGTYLIGAEL